MGGKEKKEIHDHEKDAKRKEGREGKEEGERTRARKQRGDLYCGSEGFCGWGCVGESGVEETRREILHSWGKRERGGEERGQEEKRQAEERGAMCVG